MKAKKIIYERLFNLGNYQHEKIGIEIEIEEGEKAKDVLERAKQFVNGLNPGNALRNTYEKSLSILKQKGMYSYNQVVEAEKFVEENKEVIDKEDNLPF